VTVAWFGNSTQPSVWFGDRRLIYDPTPPEPGQVVFTTAGGIFAPVIELASGSSATIEWLDTNGAIITTGLTPSITGYAQVRMRCSNYADITTVNLGYNVNEDAGQYSPGASYNKYSTDVTGIEGLSNLTGLVRFMAAGTQLTGHVDFTGLSELEFIECFNARVQSVDLTGCTSLIRLCLEANSLSNLDLNPVRNNLRDLRSAVQTTPSLTFTTLDGPMAQLYHYCIRDQIVLNIIPHAQLPVIEEHWAWNTGQTTSDAPTSPLLRSYASYGNAYDQASVDLILTTLASLITNGAWRSVDLSGGAEPSAAGWTAVTTLRNNGWNVVVAGTEPVEPSPVLLGSWPMNDSLEDISGNNLTAIADTSTAGTWTPTYTDGPLPGSRAVVFGDINQSIDYGRTGLEPTTVGFSWMAWFFVPEGAHAPAAIFGRPRGGGSTRSSAVYGDGGSPNLFWVLRWLDELHFGYEDNPSGSWHHIAIVDTDTIGAVYLDGIEVESFSRELSGTMTWEDFNWRSGWMGQGLADGSAGLQISMVRMYSGALSQAQVQSEMNRADDNTITLFDTPTGTVYVAQEPEAYTLGTEFNVVDDCELVAIRWWQGTNTPDLSTRTANVWKDNGSGWTALLAEPVEIPGSSTADTWLRGDLSTPITLTPGVYRVGVFHPHGHFSATGGYFAGNTLVTRGPLTLPYQDIATNNQQGNYSAEATIHAPDQPPYQSRNYWSDVVVRPL
jgi:hypothetical protein